MRREDRYPRCPNLSGGAASSQVEHQVEIMNHQVEDHCDIGTARLEGCQTLALDISRSIQEGLGGTEGPIIAFDVAHLKLESPTPCSGDQLISLIQCCSQWLLHEDRDAELKGTQPDLCVRWCRHRDRDGFDLGQQVIHLDEG